MEPSAIILDSGALTAFAGGAEGLRVALRKAVEANVDVAVPTIVIAKSTTGNGPRDANVNRALKALAVIDLDESLARAAADLRTRSGNAGVPDAIVIATADRENGTVVFTGDPGDLAPLAAIRGRTRVVAI